MKKKGFTLIELLAVIVILAIIALIATPMIMDVIEKSRRGAAIESVNGILESAETYRAEKLIDQEDYEREINLTSDTLKYKGSKPQKGILLIDEKGKMYVIAKYEKYCIEKGYDDLKPQIVEDSVCDDLEGNAVSAGSGFYYTVILDADGNIWGSGNNQNGSLGDSSSGLNMRLLQLGDGKKWRQVSASLEHTMAIDNEGNLYGWGSNYYGQIGDGTNRNNRNAPILIKEGTKFQSVSAGDEHTVAIDAEGNLWSWGNNPFGQLGDGTTEGRLTPIQIKTGTKFQSVSVGHGHTMAIDTDGNLWGWGQGQLGDGTTESRLTPIQIKIGTKFQSVSAGVNHTMAIDEEGNLWGWGLYYAGELGDGTTEGSITTPIQIKEETKFQSVSAGDRYTMAIDENGNLWSWGANEFGQLGDGTTVNKSVPILIKEGTKFQSVSAGRRHTTAIDFLGRVWVWGLNDAGQLGDGTTENKTIPTKIKLK